MKSYDCRNRELSEDVLELALENLTEEEYKRFRAMLKAYRDLSCTNDVVGFIKLESFAQGFAAALLKNIGNIDESSI